MSIKQVVRGFTITAPVELLPVYNQLQTTLNSILENDNNIHIILDTFTAYKENKKQKGIFHNEIKNHFKQYTQEWDLNKKAWYGYMLWESIRRTCESLHERWIIWDVLQETQGNTHKARQILNSEHNIYPTEGLLRNTVKCKERPKFPKTPRLVLDYSIGNKYCSEWVIENEVLRIKDKNFDFLYYIELPDYLKNTGKLIKISKPRFQVKRIWDRQKGSYKEVFEGNCTAFFELPEQNKGVNILGIDLGQVNLYTGVIFNTETLDYSQPFIESSKLKYLTDKLAKLQKEKNRLYDLTKIYPKHCKIEVWNKNYRILKNKISELKTSIAKQLAIEVVLTAKRFDCKEIHVENLSFLGSKGGKWNHHQIIVELESKALEYGLQVVKVSAKDSSTMHPVTKQKGVVNRKTRKIRFSKNKEIDRDVLAAVNIATRACNTGYKKLAYKTDKKDYKPKKLKTCKKDRFKNKYTPRRVKTRLKLDA